MHADMIELLACPDDHVTPLELMASVRSGPKIETGRFSCPTCHAEFEVASGIAGFLRLGADDFSDVQRTEIAARDQVSEQRTNFDIPVQSVPELDALQAAVGDCRGLTVLDAGCGIGQMTRAVRTAARIAALDFSLQSLLKFYFSGPTPVSLFHGDVCRLPFRDGSFDLTISSQVLQHVPSAELRSACLSELARTVKHGGRLAMIVYNWNAALRQRGVPKEGTHRNGIFYHCYEPEEFRTALARHFDVEAIWGVPVLLPGTYRLVTMLGRNNRYWDRIWRTRRIAHSYGSFLLGIGRKVASHPGRSGSDS